MKYHHYRENYDYNNHFWENFTPSFINVLENQQFVNHKFERYKLNTFTEANLTNNECKQNVNIHSEMSIFCSNSVQFKKLGIFSQNNRQIFRKRCFTVVQKSEKYEKWLFSWRHGVFVYVLFEILCIFVWCTN